MKQYALTKTDMFDLDIYKIHYDFKVEDTNHPTNFIKIIIHHVGKSKSIQDIIDLHVTKNHFSAIGYHFLIGKKGKIYYSRDLKYAGAHTFGYNKNSIGIGLFGNFDEETPTKEQLESLKKLITAIKKEYKIKKVLAHNQAIYELIKKKFWKLNLPKTNPIDIINKEKYNQFLQDTTTKVLHEDASDITTSLLKRLKTCPGQNMYKIIKEYQKEEKET